MLETDTILIVFGITAVSILYLALSLNFRYCRRLSLYRREVENLESQIQGKSGREIIDIANQYLNSTERISSAFSQKQVIKIRQQLLNILWRYSKAAEQLDIVPISALIDTTLSRERIKITIISFSFPQAAFLLRSTPNLLIAIGLLGTFAGITQNLGNLGSLLPQTGGIDDSSVVIASLRRPLSAMALAFYSSLFGLSCSLFLTLATYFRSPVVERQRLITTLEAFIDTVYSPVFAGETRMDKAVDRLTQQFDSFLSHFSTAVRDTLRDALEERLNSFFNISSNLLSQAESLQRQASHSSTMLLAAATRFEEAAVSFDNSIFAELLDSATVRLEKSEQQLSASALELAEQFSLVGGGLQRALNQIEQTTGAIKSTTQASAELAQSSQLLLNEIRPISLEFKKTTQSFSQTQKKLADLTKTLNALSSQQKDNIQYVKFTVEKIDQQALSTNEALTRKGSQIVEIFSELSQNLDRQSVETSQILINQSREVSEGFSQLQDKLETNSNYSRSSLERLQQEINDFLDTMVVDIKLTNQTLTSTNSDIKSQWDQLVKYVQSYLESTNDIAHRLGEVRLQNSQFLSDLQVELQELSTVFSSINDKQDSSLSQINYQTSLILNKLSEILSMINRGVQS